MRWEMLDRLSFGSRPGTASVPQCMHGALSVPTPAGLFAILALSLFACSAPHDSLGKAASPKPMQLPQQYLTPGGGVLPPLAELRKVFGLVQTQLDGTDTYSRGPGASEMNGSLHLYASPGKLSWAMWAIASNDELQYLDISLASPVAPAGGGIYTALADFSTGRWVSSGPRTESIQYALDQQKHLSSRGAVLVAVLAWNGASVDVPGLTLSALHQNQAPSAALTAAPQSGTLPLQVDFDASASTDPDPGDSILTYHWDFDGDGTEEETGSSPLLQHTYNISGDFPARVRVEDSAGLSSLSLPLAVSVNAPPQAALDVSPAVVQTGDEITLDASLSQDSDGSIVNYEWDSNGDGNFDASGPAPQHVCTIGGPGLFELAVRVTDDEGGSATAYGSVQVNGNMNAQTLADNCRALRMLLVAGRPALAFVNPQNNCACFIRASDDLGTAWSEPLIVSGSDQQVMGGIGLAVVDGQPAVAYIADSGDNLRYVRAMDSTGSAWAAPLNIDSPTDAKLDCDLQLIAGRPALAFSSNNGTSSSSIHYVRASDSAGTAWDPYETLDTVTYSFDPAVMHGPCLREINSRPAVCYTRWEWWSMTLCYVRADDSGGADWPLPLDLPGISNSNLATLEVLDGKPVVCFYDAGWVLSLLRAQDTDGTNWNAVEHLNYDGSADSLPSLKLIDGKPCIAFQTYGGLVGTDSWVDLSLLCAQDAQGNIWGDPILLEHDHDAGSYPCLVELSGGKLGCAACNITAKDLRYFHEE